MDLFPLKKMCLFIRPNEAYINLFIDGNGTNSLSNPLLLSVQAQRKADTVFDMRLVKPPFYNLLIMTFKTKGRI